jgi:hypothetical protein
MRALRDDSYLGNQHIDPIIPKLNPPQTLFPAGSAARHPSRFNLENYQIEGFGKYVSVDVDTLSRASK